MSKPEEVSQDIWDVVQTINTVLPYITVQRTIARAIMAERERCAKIAEWMADTNSEFLPEEVVIACGHTAVAISNAIRNGDF